MNIQINLKQALYMVDILIEEFEDRVEAMDTRGMKDEFTINREGTCNFCGSKMIGFYKAFDHTKNHLNELVNTKAQLTMYGIGTINLKDKHEN